MGVLKEFNSLWELFLTPLYLIVIFFIANRIAQNKREEHPYYRYFVPGLFVKIAGGLFFTAIYTFYYEGGDCHAYFQGGRSLNNLLLKEPQAYFSIMAGHTDATNWSYFDPDTGYPPNSMYEKGGENFAVARYISPFLLLSFNFMTIAQVLLNCVAFAGIWRFYRMLCSMYPKLEKKLAFSCLFIPSIAFWGSGIMKDTFTFAATLWLTSSVHMLFTQRRSVIPNIIFIALSLFFIITIKPYIVIALLPCLGISISYSYVKMIPNRVVSVALGPLLLVLGLFLGALGLSSLSSQMGTYSSVEGVLSKAQINQQDLVRAEAYGRNNFNIGYFEADPVSMLKKAPQAIVAGIFRPFLWEARNPVMIISGIENTLLILLILYLIKKAGIRRLITYTTGDPFVLFAVMFCVLFEFSVGLSTANFGALVRYKIPGIIFLVSALMIVWGRTEAESKLIKNE